MVLGLGIPGRGQWNDPPQDRVVGPIFQGCLSNKSTPQGRVMGVVGVISGRLNNELNNFLHPRVGVGCYSRGVRATVRALGQGGGHSEGGQSLPDPPSTSGKGLHEG